METNPKISVCMPAYNNGNFIAEAIESVLGQTFADFELLIIDDCSLDETYEVAFGYKNRDSRIVLLKNGQNLGMVQNWNRCIDLARGEYIKFLFADDLLSSPNALEEFLKPLGADSRISLVASARNIIDADSRPQKINSHFPDCAVVEGSSLIRRSICEQRNLIGEPSVVMFRKNQATRGFDPRLKQLVDLEMWLHLLEKGDFYFIGAPIASFRVHPDQQTQKNLQTLALFEDIILMLEEYLDRPYMNLRRVSREFLFFSQYYRVWKSGSNGVATCLEAFSKIGGRYKIWEFFLLFPLYKICSPVWKIRLKATNLK